ncbi:MAG: AAA family ATPase, partial [Alphaproteobacteria bacterium]|nr:AAA family ATPase [Alphaproteobacteria bacterium]
MQGAACKADNSDDRLFCLDCGAPLPHVCAACGFANQAGARFCGGCGAALAAEGAPPTAPPTPPAAVAPESYTPRHLKERILASREALEGERKQVTVLFADIRGSLELIEGVDAEVARTILDSAVAAMSEAVHRYEGTVNKVLGDGIMALFGAPLAHEDHALRAVYAALAMQRSIAEYARQARREHGVEVMARVGLHSGEVVVRAIGNDLSMDYDAIGPTVHLSSRMEQLAAPGSIRLSADTLRLVEGYVEVEALGPVPVKGLKEPVEVFELRGAPTGRTRLHTAAMRGLTRFVGRDDEIAALDRARDQAAKGQGQIVAVVADAGVGKSRLYHEFTHAPDNRDWLVLESSSVSYGTAHSWLPVIELLKRYFRVDDRDPRRRIGEKVAGKLVMLDEALKPMLTPLLSLLGGEVDDAAWRALEPPLRRRRTLDAVKALFLREAQVQPLMLVFEDLHWIDGETQALLDGLADSLPTNPILLLVNYRPEYEHGWGGRTYYTQHRINPLGAESAGALLSALLGDERELEALKQSLIERTGGTPLFLEESVRTLVESGALSGEGGAYRLTGALDASEMPATIQAMLAARIDRLEPDQKRLLQSASVIGPDVSLALLEAVSDLPPEALQEGLAALQAGEFLDEADLFEREYAFKHALTRDVAYQSLLQEHRRTLHTRIVLAMEELHADRLTEQVERLAEHALRGEVWDKAEAYFWQSGAKAATRAAYRDAVSCYEQALAALEHLPEGRETHEHAIDLRIDLRHALFPLGEFGRMAWHLHGAEERASALGDDVRLGQVT